MINKQRHAATCGPVAIKNVLEVLGVKVSYEDMVAICRKNYYWPEYGMHIKGIKRVLNKFNVKHVFKRGIVKKDITKALKEGKILILLYVNKKEGHYVTIDKETTHFYRAWNWAPNRSNIMPKEKLMKYIRYTHRYYGKEGPVAFIIKRNIFLDK